MKQVVVVVAHTQGRAGLRRERWPLVLAVLCALALVACGVFRVSAGAFKANTDNGSGWDAATLALTDDDTGTAMFSTAAAGLLDGGQSQTKCLKVTFSGTLNNGSVEVHGYAQGISGALAPYLDLVVEDGTGGTNASCGGFSGARTLYSGTLAGFGAASSDFTTGVGDWAPSPGDTRTYRFTTTVRNVPAAQNASAAASFVWQAKSGQPWTPAKLAAKSLWVRANDLGAGGSTVASWPDRSGNGFNGSPLGGSLTVAGNSDPAGGKSVRFNVNGALSFGDLGLTTMTMSSYGTYPTANPVSNLFDGSAATWWRDDGPTWPRWATFTVDAPQAITSYRMQGNTTNAAYNPSAWKLYGSNDGATWTVLDSQTGQTLTTAFKSYPVAGAGVFSRYKIEVSATSTSLMFLSGIEVYTGATKATVLPRWSTSMEAWVVLKADPWQNGRLTGLWEMYDGAGAGGTLLSQYPSGSNTAIQEKAGIPIGTAGTYNLNGTVDTRSWRVYRMAVDATGGVDLWLDGVLMNHQSYQTWRSAWAPVMTLGQSATAAGSPNYFAGNIAEVLIRPTRSSAQDATRIGKYLNSEHGLSAVVP